MNTLINQLYLGSNRMAANKDISINFFTKLHISILGEISREREDPNGKSFFIHFIFYCVMNEIEKILYGNLK